MKKTKIVATIGPASDSKENIKALIQAGVNVFRLNFSHGTHSEHATFLKNIREVANKLGTRVGVLQDLGGPKIRIGDFEEKEVTLKKGAGFVLTTDEIAGNNEIVHVNYKKLPAEVVIGGKLLLDDGKVELKVEKVRGSRIYTTVVHGGDIKSRRGVNAPGANLSIKTLTKKDKKDLLFCSGETLKESVDFIALSFVRSAKDIKELRKELKAIDSKASIVAKIETIEAIEAIDEIIDATDIVMIARGDLAVEIPAENVPFWQKQIIAKCRNAGKPVIVATQMFESMIYSPVPTRAEVSDVANAILDGTDAIMLSGETAVGKHPVAAVSTMARVARRIELENATRLSVGADNLSDGATAITSVLLDLSENTKVTQIVTLTEHGSTARKVARYRPHKPVTALTPNIHTAQQLTIVFGVESIIVNEFTSIDDVLKRIPVILTRNKFAAKGTQILLTTGTTFGSSGTTNTVIMLKI